MNCFKQNKMQEKNITCTCTDSGLMSGRVSFASFPVLVNMLTTVTCVMDTNV